ncbi:MAG: hypothetical protein P1R58_10975 [bacterium]|nr:hypothetical protein [bacterium]
MLDFLKRVKKGSRSARAERIPSRLRLASPKPVRSTDPLVRTLELSRRDVSSGRHKIQLYRFLADNIPVISSCIWTWARLSAASGKFKTKGKGSEQAEVILKALSDRVYASNEGHRSGLSGLLPDLFTNLFRDGCAGGFLLLDQGGRQVDRFHLIDPADLEIDPDSGVLRLAINDKEQVINLDRPDFSMVTLGDTGRYPTGRSILQPIPFVSYIEQQLVDDMRRASHNSGFHRLHVKITPPERYGGESDQSYVGRINEYFDSTVEMIKSCDVDENPVTWDNVEVQYIGPENSRSVTNSWFMQHRAMVEEIAAGTNLAPFLLGYSYGATTTWASFKFDLVMRQVRTVQAEAARIFQWLGNVELGLHGLQERCRFQFDNSFAYQATEQESVRSSSLDSILKLYQAGLISESEAREKAGELL